ncbi:nuclear factor NF-kappa-B p105 subunit isoform X2 [Nerophis ophidion]|uniref:nuclear factor NF-kappa-B p105 subunit isoform X1 n=2 Tax=Nerophis ophidion TaxID=159077 RepID=UPI002ADF6D9E|nr:nuclear factor NF-kappa-B p105 subunit isoform X1 [Nerophis ophidion]XP_061747877.1 nuclear factor NF-kappa-B p105 subunit isoform X2 [Nerophis ophidion]
MDLPGTMAGDDHFLPANSQILDTLMMDPSWDFPQFTTLTSHSSSLRTGDGPFLQILEQPKQILNFQTPALAPGTLKRGFRFRYGCEGPSHGGLPGASSEKNKKTCPAVKICNYQGPARVVVQLVTALTNPPQLHAHSLVGKHCDNGVCMIDVPAKDSNITFPNLGILHVTKKNVAKTLEGRMIEAFRMGYNFGVSIHTDIDSLQGEGRIPREISEHQCSLISSVASLQAKEMDLSVVRLMFTAFLPDSDGAYTRRLDPVVSEAIYDSKAPNASNLKIVRMDRTAGCVSGGEEVYLLCDKVQKDDIQVRFYEEDDSGVTWEALGDFSPTDVHRQFAIVFKTPKYRDQNLKKATSVFVQLKRKSDNETSEPKPFTYHPQIIDKEEVQRKRQKTLPNFQDFSGHGGGAGTGGGLYRGGGGGPLAGGGPGSAGGAYFQGYSTYNYGRGAGGGACPTGYSTGLGGEGVKQASQDDSADSSADDSDSDDHSEGGVVLARSGRQEEEEESQSDGDMVSSRHVDALFHYAVTGNMAYLLALQRPLMAAQDEDGDTGLHLAVLHSQQAVLASLTQVLGASPGDGLLDTRNHLYQTPLHLAVITQQKEAVEVLLAAGADPALTDRHGNTLLHLASQQDGGEMVHFLLGYRSIRGLLETCNTAGLCAIHLAVLANQLTSLRELLEGGANVEAQERSSGRTALHLATEYDNVSLAGCLLLEGNAVVDCCTFNGSTPLHIAAGRGSNKLTALLMAAGADPNKENLEPLFFREDEEEEEEDEGYVPGSSPINMAASAQVLELLSGKEYRPKSPGLAVPPQGDLGSLGVDVKRTLCRGLESDGCWEDLADSLGLGILKAAFRLSPSPSQTLLDSYEVSGGTVHDLTAALRSVGQCKALSVLEEALCHQDNEAAGKQMWVSCVATRSLTGAVVSAGDATHAQLRDLKFDNRVDSGVCDSGVELSTA